jgi:hypothetical protein
MINISIKQDMQYFKLMHPLLSESNYDSDYKYRKGINVFDGPFISDAEIQGGLFFSDQYNIFKFIGPYDSLSVCNAGNLRIARVRLFDDSIIVSHVGESNDDVFRKIYKTNKFVLEKIQRLDDFFVENPEFCIEAIEQDSFAICYIKNKTTDICINAVRKNYKLLCYIHNQNPEICMAAVKTNGNALRYVKHKTTDICMEAVKKDGDALNFVDIQLPEICMEAVKSNPSNIIYINDQNAEKFSENLTNVYLMAIKKNSSLLQYVKNQSPENLKKIYLEAVKNNGLCLIYIKDQTLEICIEAIKQNKLAIQYVEKEFKEDCLKMIG